MPPATQSSVQEIIKDLEPRHLGEIPLDNEEAPNIAEAINLMNSSAMITRMARLQPRNWAPSMVLTPVSLPVPFSFAISISITICHMPMTTQRLPLQYSS